MVKAKRLQAAGERSAEGLRSAEKAETEQLNFKQNGIKKLNHDYKITTLNLATL